MINVIQFLDLCELSLSFKVSFLKPKFFVTFEQKWKREVPILRDRKSQPKFLTVGVYFVNQIPEARAR